MRVYDMIDFLMIALGMDKLDVVLSIAMLLCQKRHVIQASNLLNFDFTKFPENHNSQSLFTTYEQVANMQSHPYYVMSYQTMTIK